MDDHSPEALARSLEESDSLMEHVLLTSDYFEHQVGRLLSQAGDASLVLGRLNCSPREKLLYALGGSRILDDTGERGVFLVWGWVRGMVDLRERLAGLRTEDLEQAARSLCDPTGVTHLGTLKLWDAYAVGTAIYVDSFAVPADGTWD